MYSPHNSDSIKHGLVEHAQRLLPLARSSAAGDSFNPTKPHRLDLVHILYQGRTTARSVFAASQTTHWAFEIKHGLDPRPRKGLHSACQDVRP